MLKTIENINHIVNNFIRGSNYSGRNRILFPLCISIHEPNHQLMPLVSMSQDVPYILISLPVSFCFLLIPAASRRCPHSSVI